MLSTALPVKAQDVKAQVDAITKVVIDAKGDVKATKDAVKEFTKVFKKNPQALAGLGRAFFDGGNEAEALKYADMAIKANKNSAFGYLLKGDMAAVKDQAGEAAMWYQTATQFDPKDPTGYVKYARVYQKVDPKGAVEMLEKLRQVKPDYPVDAAAGYMYSNANKLKSAMEYYDKVKDVTKLDDYILSDYATTAFVMEQYEKTLPGQEGYSDLSRLQPLQPSGLLQQQQAEELCRGCTVCREDVQQERHLEVHRQRLSELRRRALQPRPHRGSYQGLQDGSGARSQQERGL